MTVKMFEAVLSINDLSEKIGKLTANNELKVSDANYMLVQLRFISEAVGEANKPSVLDSYNNGVDKVNNNKAYYATE